MRFVQIYSRRHGQRTQLGRPQRHRRAITAASPARPTSRSPACSTDLEARGLLDSTLVIWGGEFGRLPIVQKGERRAATTTRTPSPIWMAGGGVKGGTHHGETDEIGHKAVDESRQRQRPARHHPAPARPGPHEADVPLQRPRLPADRCGGESGHADCGVTIGDNTYRLVGKS